MGRLSSHATAAHEIVVTGRVQGVGFRWFTRDAAARLGLSGWVANRADGAVAVEVAGAAGAVESFLVALREGPPGSLVTDVRATPIDPARVTLTNFEIRR